MPGISVLPVLQSQQMMSSLGFNGCVHGASKTQVIRAIQMKRGDEPCFASDQRHDCALLCEWRRDCRKLMAAWMR